VRDYHSIMASLIRLVLLSMLVLVSLDGTSRADACLGGGGPPDDPPPKKDAQGMLTPAPRPQGLRFAGGGLVFVGALGGVWLAARGKKRPPDGV
jgi:hypothetical protein